MTEQWIVRHGTVFDGTGSPRKEVDIHIRDGRIVAMGPKLDAPGAKEIDAKGKWITPGFLDIHTHYDAEVEVLPGLDESVRHGVTTVVMGNCSLSAAVGTPDQLVDLFCRVESLPRPLMTKWLGDKVTWKTPAEYYDHLDSLPLGPNVASFLGHSNIRLAAMGTKRALSPAEPTSTELATMKHYVKEALDHGFLGLSIDMLPWHRWDGDAHKGTSVPSQQAKMSEYAALADVVRDAGGVLQATPNALKKETVARIFRLSMSKRGKKPLKTTIVAAMDVKTDRKVYKMAQIGAKLVSELFRGDIRFQALAEPFTNYCDGVFGPLFEEFPAGVAAISASETERRAMFADAKYRKMFRAQWTEKKTRVFHKDLGDMWIVESPDASMVGKSFRDVAKARGLDEVECFMDLMRDHDRAIRWKTEVSNDRPGPRRELMASPYTLPGFNDSGAHNRNMAFYDGALQMLQQMQAHPDTMTMERAVHRLTGEAASWLGIDAGVLAKGKRADLVILDPEELPNGLSAPIEFVDERLDGEMRLVKRSDRVVKKVIVGGRLAFADGRFSDDYGKAPYGRLLRRGAVA